MTQGFLLFYKVVCNGVVITGLGMDVNWAFARWEALSDIIIKKFWAHILCKITTLETTIP